MLQCCAARFCIHFHTLTRSTFSWSVLKTRKESFHNFPVINQKKQSNDSPLNIFDRQAKIYQKERAAIAEDVSNFDYVKSEVGERLADRIYDIKRELHTVLDLGSSRNYLAKHVSSDNVKKLVCCDVSELLTRQSKSSDPSLEFQQVVVNEENLSENVGEESVDLVISNLSLHWVNNLPQCFNEIMKVLKKDGVFMATVFGGDTLYELRSSLQLAELERLGGLAAHISPFARVRDIGSLLTRSGYTMQTIDTEEIVVGYPSMVDLMLDLKGMGENNAAWNRKLHLGRDVIFAASSIYNQLYGKEEGDRFGIPATYQIIYFLGWKPDPSQPTPLERGSGEVSLKDLYKLDEIVKQKGKVETDDK